MEDKVIEEEPPKIEFVGTGKPRGKKKCETCNMTILSSSMARHLKSKSHSKTKLHK